MRRSAEDEEGRVQEMVAAVANTCPGEGREGGRKGRGSVNYLPTSLSTLQGESSEGVRVVVLFPSARTRRIPAISCGCAG